MAVRGTGLFLSLSFGHMWDGDGWVMDWEVLFSEVRTTPSNRTGPCIPGGGGLALVPLTEDVDRLVFVRAFPPLDSKYKCSKLVEKWPAWVCVSACACPFFSLPRLLSIQTLQVTTSS